jgi:hypothetical protein
LAGSRLESLEDSMDAAAEEEWNQEIARRIAELGNETASDKFVAELDRAIEIAGRDTPTLASRRPWHSEVRPAAIPVCYFLSGETGSRPSAGHRSRAPATRVLEGSAFGRQLIFTMEKKRDKSCC